jgi:hypothetical protein
MKTVFLALIPLIIIFISPAYAANLCVGLAKNKYCLGKPLPKKADSYEVTTLDGGIDIETRKNRRSRYVYGNEVDGLSGLSLTTTLVTQYGKVASINQYYRIDPKDHQSKDRVYFLLERRLTRQYGKPSTRTILEELKYTEWRSHLIDINISDADEENVSVSFSIGSRR